MRLLIVGNPQPTHVGLHFLNAVRGLGHEVDMLDVNAASAGPVWWRRACWHLCGHRPPRLASFSRAVVTTCLARRPDWVLVTGLAPIDAAALGQLRQAGVPTVNFLTDDPWNPQHKAPWFMRALPHYRYVFTPRHSNEADLSACGVPGVSYLPFAYAPEDHHPPDRVTEEELRRLSEAVVFIGGADADRVSVIHTLAGAGVPVSLWGGYWNKFPSLAAHARGHADTETCRKIVHCAGANLGLVRKANRDGHSMRSYELPAIGGSLLMEDTADHRQIYGTDGKAALLFDSDESMIQQARRILAWSPEERTQMANEARHRVAGAANTYADRLMTMQTTLFG